MNTRTYDLLANAAMAAAVVSALLFQSFPQHAWLLGGLGIAAAVVSVSVYFLGRPVSEPIQNGRIMATERESGLRFPPTRAEREGQPDSGESQKAADLLTFIQAGGFYGPDARCTSPTDAISADYLDYLWRDYANVAHARTVAHRGVYFPLGGEPPDRTLAQYLSAQVPIRTVEPAYARLVSDIAEETAGKLILFFMTPEGQLQFRVKQESRSSVAGAGQLAMDFGTENPQRVN